MFVSTYQDPEEFRNNTQADLESQEAANSLMLGILGQLSQHPEWFSKAPCLKTVHDQNGLVLAAVMTPPNKLVLYGRQVDIKAGSDLLVNDLRHENWDIPGVMGPSRVAEILSKKWASITTKEVHLEQNLRVYELREVLTPPPEHDRLRLARETDADLVSRWWYGFNMEVFGSADVQDARQRAANRIKNGDVYLWEDGMPVSMAMKTRPTRTGISVGMVYTPPELRRRGYAGACVGELSRMLLNTGWKYCALFADLANPTSNSIYQRIGYEPVCDYNEYKFI